MNHPWHEDLTVYVTVATACVNILDVLNALRVLHGFALLMVVVVDVPSQVVTRVLETSSSAQRK